MAKQPALSDEADDMTYEALHHFGRSQNSDTPALARKHKLAADHFADASRYYDKGHVEAGDEARRRAHQFKAEAYDMTLHGQGKEFPGK